MRPIDLRVLLFAATLFGLCAYSAIVGPTQMVSIAEVLADPVASAGKEVELASNVRVVQASPGEFLVQQRRVRIRVRATEHEEKEWGVWRKQPQIGDYVSLRAVFHPEGYLILHEIHVHTGRLLKIWVSIFALFLLAGILIRERTKAPFGHA
jgi:hypothetical protein